MIKGIHIFEIQAIGIAILISQNAQSLFVYTHFLSKYKAKYSLLH